MDESSPESRSGFNFVVFVLYLLILICFVWNSRLMNETGGPGDNPNQILFWLFCGVLVGMGFRTFLNLFDPDING